MLPHARPEKISFDARYSHRLFELHEHEFRLGPGVMIPEDDRHPSSVKSGTLRLIQIVESALRE